MKKIHMIKILFFFLFLTLSTSIFSEETVYTVKTSEDRITYLVSLIERNLTGSSVLKSFKEEQEAWELYKNKHINMLFPDSIDNVKMLWGSVSSNEIGDEILSLNLERIQTLEKFLLRDSESGTDGRGEFKEYVEELKKMQNR